MLELIRTEAAVITVVGAPDAMTAASSVDAYVGRVAPDELMLIAAPGRAAEVLAAAGDAIEGDDALVVDATDGWTIWTLTGEATDRAMARLTAIELEGDGLHQGDVARVPAKIVTEPGRVHLLVPAMWEAYLRARILERCARLGIRERPDPEPWTATGAGPVRPAEPARETTA